MGQIQAVPANFLLSTGGETRLASSHDLLCRSTSSSSNLAPPPRLLPLPSSRTTLLAASRLLSLVRYAPLCC